VGHCRSRAPSATEQAIIVSSLAAEFAIRGYVHEALAISAVDVQRSIIDVDMPFHG
jgi:hypothetical protein